MSVDPILREFPYSFETERLMIRGLLPGDGGKLRTAIVESQKELIPWMPWAINILSEVEQEARACKSHLQFLAREDLQMVIFLKGTDTLIGGTGLHRINWNVPKFEIGYWLHSHYTRQGYMTEAVDGLTDFAFDLLGARRVEIRCDVMNVRSSAVPKRLNFVHEATLKHDDRDHTSGELRDTMIFAKVRRDGE